MKQPAIIIVALFSIALCGHAQPPELFSKKWKMEKITSVYKSDTSMLFNKDSASNNLDYTSSKYSFYSNGTYIVTSDTSSNQGSWSLRATGDSAIIDNVPYRLIELSADHFVTRGFTLTVIDDAGTIDTAYTYVAMYPETTLPVTLISFTGRYVNNQVILNWSTAQEQQNKEFQIQYSPNGTSFESIGTVPGKGNSAATAAYDFSTNRYQTGKNFYRLKQIDLDGHSALSPIVVISIDASMQSFISLSPNPASNKINLSMSHLTNDNLQLVLSTVAGQKVWSTTVAGNTANATIYLPALTKGIYIVSIINGKGDQVFYNKLVLQ